MDFCFNFGPQKSHLSFASNLVILVITIIIIASCARISIPISAKIAPKYSKYFLGSLRQLDDDDDDDE